MQQPICTQVQITSVFQKTNMVRAIDQSNRSQTIPPFQKRHARQFAHTVRLQDFDDGAGRISEGNAVDKT
nr:hypothetical protein [Agrobacterium bohemicum]